MVRHELRPFKFRDVRRSPRDEGTTPCAIRPFEWLCLNRNQIDIERRGRVVLNRRGRMSGAILLADRVHGLSLRRSVHVLDVADGVDVDAGADSRSRSGPNVLESGRITMTSEPRSRDTRRRTRPALHTATATHIERPTRRVVVPRECVELDQRGGSPRTPPFQVSALPSKTSGRGDDSVRYPPYRVAVPQ